MHALRWRRGRALASDIQWRLSRETQGPAGKPSRLHGAREGGQPPAALLRRALLTTTYVKLGHSYTSSHSRTHLSVLPDATIRPSGLMKHTECTIPPCPSSVLTHAPVSASHSRSMVW